MHTVTPTMVDTQDVYLSHPSLYAMSLWLMPAPALLKAALAGVLLGAHASLPPRQPFTLDTTLGCHVQHPYVTASKLACVLVNAFYKQIMPYGVILDDVSSKSCDMVHGTKVSSKPHCL
eukprot:1159955-Pelagomonas_calceolata.AAC.12